MSYGRGVVTSERGKYRARVPNGRGGYVSIGAYPTRAEAEAMIDAYHLERAAAGAPAMPGSTLLEYGERVLARWSRAGQRDAGNTRSRWRIVARASFAREPLSALTRADVRDWARELPRTRATRAVMRGGEVARIDTLDRPISWQTCKHTLGLLARVLDEAVVDGLIADNPARGIKLPRRQERAEGYTWLRPAELAAVLALELTAEQRTAITLAVYQGLRQGELAALSWSCVDLDAGWLVIGSSWDSATKSGRVRRIPLLAPAAAALRAWRPEAAQRKGLVLPSPHGGCYARGHDWGWGDRRAGRDLPSRAGITRRVRWHDLRHTCAAHLVSGSWGRAWTIEEVREYLGHTSSDVTARYAHLAPDALHATAAATATGGQPAADLPHEIAAAARVLLDFASKSGARGNGFEPVTFGSGGRRFSSDRANLGGSRQVRGGCPAEAVLRAAADGRPVPAAALLALAIVALEGDSAGLALRALAGGPDAARAAVELAGLAETLAPGARERAR